jgi:tetratricopeptide (TPR) repeat protein
MKVLAINKPQVRPPREELQKQKKEYLEIIEGFSHSALDIYKREVALAHSNLGQVCMDLGEFQDAQSALNTSLEEFRRLNDKRLAGIVSVQLAQVFVQIGKQRDAEQLLSESFVSFADLCGKNSLAARQSKKRLDRFLRTGRITHLEENAGECV